ncbi:MAG: TIGR04086 family membrane protein [Clostridia bacterium]
MGAKIEKSEPKFIIIILKSALIALAISLIGILIFAFVMRFFAVPDGAIRPINQIIKCVSVMIGCFFGLKKTKEKGLVSGLLVGLIYTLISFLVFSALNGEFEFTKLLINDLLFGGVIGAICGIISVGFRKEKNA